MKEQKDRDQKTKEITTSSNETLGFESERTTLITETLYHV